MRGIAESWHEYIFRVRLIVCEVGVFMREMRKAFKLLNSRQKSDTVPTTNSYSWRVIASSSP